MKEFLCSLAIFVIVTIGSHPLAYGQQSIKDLRPTVILISLDGFRYDYLDKWKPQTINKLARSGVRAKWLVPSFPTKTFPNHYAIATGLYPEHNGIVENNINDFGVTFTMSNKDEVQNSRWWLGEPIWSTAEKQNQKAAAMFFPGTEAEIAGYRPTYWRPYEHTLPHEERVNQILQWFDVAPDKRPTFFTLYFDDVDTAGHKYSPDSQQTKDAVFKVDSAIKRLLDGLAKRKIRKKVNIIIVSDHGMATLDQRNAVLLDDYIDLDFAEKILWTGEIVQIFPQKGKLDEMAAALKNVNHATCWKRTEIPARLNYNEGNRIAPIVCSAEEGWLLSNHAAYQKLQKDDDFGKPKGAHGYDNKYESMRAIFVASGPAFKRHKVVEAFANVDVYNVMCKVLGLTPAPNDGNSKTAQTVLR